VKSAVPTIPEIVSVAVPLLVSVIGEGWLAVLTTWLPKLKRFGENATAGAETTLSRLPSDELPQP
jgi:hypothetical protein